jgi:hypothetical protein
MRTNMQKPEQIDPKAFDPNTASNSSLREHIYEEPSLKAVRMVENMKEKWRLAGV